MFRTHQPVTGSAFFDRVGELAALEDHVARLQAGAPPWVALLGARKVGKTSLILELARRVAARNVAFVTVDVMEEQPVSLAIFRRMAMRAVDQLLGDSLGTSVEQLADSPAEYRRVWAESEVLERLPRALRSTLLELPEIALDAAGLRQCLELPERLAQALGGHVIVAIDEFQELATLGGGVKLDPLPLMRSVWQRHARVGYFISGSGRTMLTELVTRRHSPFFQHFALMEISPFSADDACALLRSASPPDRPIDEPLARRAVAALGTHPFYLQLLGEAMTREPPPYDESSLKAAIQELLFSPTGRLALYFQNELERLVGRSTFLAAAVTALSAGPAKLGEVAAVIHARSGDTARYLERLSDAVTHQEDRYELADPVFALWVAWRRPGGTVIPMRLLGDQAERDAAQELARMGFDVIYQSRASRGAFDLLAVRSGEQLGLQVKRSPLPLRFAISEWNRMSATAKELGWRWVVCAVSPEGRVQFLDPAHARKAREVRLTESTVIPNLLAWLHAARVRGR